MHRMTSRRQKRDFWRVFCCFEAVCLILLSLSAGRTIQIERRSYQQQLHARTQRVEVALSAELTNCISTCNAVFSSTWYMHFRNHADLYAQEFTPLRRQEIIDDLRSKASAQKLLSDIVVITPSKDSVINRENWLCMEDYQRFCGELSIAANEDVRQPPEIAVTDSAYLAIVLNDVNRRYEAGVIVALLSVRAIAETVSAQLDEACVGFRLLSGGEAVYEWGGGARAEADGFSLSYPDVTLQLSYRTWAQTGLRTCLMEYALMLMLASALCAALSYVLAVVLYEPIRRLLAHFNLKGGRARSDQDPFEEIIGYMDSFRDQYRELAMERVDLANQLERHSELIRQEALSSLLTEPGFESGDRCLLEMFPWLRDRLPCLLALCVPSEAGAAPPLTGLEGEAEDALHFYRLNRPDGCVCMIYWYADREEACQKREQMLEHQGSRLRCTVGVSEVLQDAGELSGAYEALRRSLQEQQAQRGALPFRLTLSLMQEIQKGNGAQCDRLLLEARQKHDALSLFGLLSRIAEEYGVDFSEAEECCAAEPDENTAWEGLSHAAHLLCEAIGQGEELEDASEKQAVQILEYIGEHAYDPELCVNQLADHFGMHRTMIARLLKNHFGLSFSDYLLKLRIGKAQQMLRETDLSLAEIAEQTGYTAYLTFKRAFIRHTGMLPKDYRQQTG